LPSEQRCLLEGGVRRHAVTFGTRDTKGPEPMFARSLRDLSGSLEYRTVSSGASTIGFTVPRSRVRNHPRQ
jgi:hypothetical protein